MQAHDGDILDASNLTMTLVFFVAPKGPRMLGTLDAINRSPKDGGLVSNGLAHRQDVEKSPDGLEGNEGTFNSCTCNFAHLTLVSAAFNLDRALGTRD